MHWDNPEEWDGEGGSGWGTHVHPWLMHVNVWQKPPQHCKVISLQLNKKKNKVTFCDTEVRTSAYEFWEGCSSAHNIQQQQAEGIVCNFDLTLIKDACPRLAFSFPFTA